MACDIPPADVAPLEAATLQAVAIGEAVRQPSPKWLVQHGREGDLAACQKCRRSDTGGRAQHDDPFADARRELLLDYRLGGNR